ncbi:N,N-dimethylformamidase beta subunit family domain-containing protein [Mycolicibacterium sp. 050158]|uniref:N,N-dimethylformamidase beta subunit family domain-containing protein n=1 Tax=Mycolicibacterium sp. 050158 TaxID=3090602 RepID=UPI00299D4B9D|nr:N,N-dimethylformamidase beta subunit family domain-containing protein [Mycolicibacterium sp. 050158]MDX1888026.1 DUF6605 domain-containing protein [Mycolicibacterium sp. 050158]
MKHDPTTIFGYTDRFSARPGETLSFHVSSDEPTRYDASLVRLSHGYTGSAGPGFVEYDVPGASFAGSYAGEHHVCQPGSFVEIDDPKSVLADPADVAISVYVYATLPLSDRADNIGAYHVTQNSMSLTNKRQTICGTWDEDTATGYALVLDDGVPTVLWGQDGQPRTLSTASVLQANHWYRLDLHFGGGAGEVQLTQTPIANCMNQFSDQASPIDVDEATAALGEGTPARSAHPFRIAALARRDGDRWLAVAPFNGKIGALTVTRGGDPIDGSGAELLARWHFGRSSSEDGLLLWDVVDLSDNNLHGRCFNAPIRAVTGPFYAGLSEDFRHAPDDFDAIHFHDDDIADAEWPVAFTFAVPDDLPSGVYAARLMAHDKAHYVPFIVGPGSRKKEVALLLPTATYLAYANDRTAFEADGAEVIVSHTPILNQNDVDLQNHPEFGRCCYEIHNDGSGVVFSSVRKPIITLQPKHRAWYGANGVWGLPADLCIVHWLDSLDCEFDVITDEDLDAGGYELLADYKVVITGAHPEYVTRGELDALDLFTARGGRLMYLGGNGFFATASFVPDQPYVLELRRSAGGTRPHQSNYGERRHATSGEMAGLWRHKGKAPQRLTGVGFAAQGFDRSTHYERLEDSRDPLAAFVFEGIGDDEIIGDFGIMGGGAAGAEIDCYDPALGSPPGTLVLATSGPLTDAFLVVIEEVYENLPGQGGTEHPYVRSDMVLGALEGGGGFFSVGSIAWTAALSHNGYDNNVARITGNVLKRFVAKEPLDQIAD